MSQNILNAMERTAIGSNAVKKLRSSDNIPGVLYGHHIESQPIQITKHDYEQFIKHHGVGASLDLNINGNKVFSVFKEAQINYLKNETVHVEFQALSKGEKLKITVPLILLGKEKIPSGLLLQETHGEITLNLLPKDLIEKIELDVSNAVLGDTFSISDLDIAKEQPDSILDPFDTLLYTVTENKANFTEETEETVAANDIPVANE